MGERTAIEWAANADGSPGATWNPIVGCSVLSPGCANCYAMREAGGPRLGAGAKYAGLTQPSKAGPVWTGEVRLWEPALGEPLRRKKPTVWFVNSMGDLFHEAVSDAMLDRVWAVMALCPQHTFIVLTKRAVRMREYLNNQPSGRRRWEDVMRQEYGCDAVSPAPVLANVWAGVSAEDQARADERIPELLATLAAKRVVSCEPLLWSVDLTELPSQFDGAHRPLMRLNALAGEHRCGAAYRPAKARLDWVIVGGESGPGARPMHPDWARRIRNDCAAAGVPFFFKQWGEWIAQDCVEGAHRPLTLMDRAGVRDQACTDPDSAWWFEAIGKRRAGRELDGRTHNARPEIG